MFKRKKEYKNNIYSWVLIFEKFFKIYVYIYF